MTLALFITIRSSSSINLLTCSDFRVRRIDPSLPWFYLFVSYLSMLHVAHIRPAVVYYIVSNDQ